MEENGVGFVGFVFWFDLFLVDEDMLVVFDVLVVI